MPFRQIVAYKFDDGFVTESRDAAMQRELHQRLMEILKEYNEWKGGTVRISDMDRLSIAEWLSLGPNINRLQWYFEN